MAGTILSSDQNGVRTLALNRPRRLNALNSELLSDLNAALGAAQKDESAKVIVLCGTGRAFCSGDDLKEFREQTGSEEAVRRHIEAIQNITRLVVLGDKVVLGAIHGWAVGGGLEWAINCDLTIFAEDTRCFFPEIRWGMFPTGGVTAILPRLIGLQRTRELMLFGAEFNARQALDMNLAWKVVANDHLCAFAQETAERIAALPQGSVRDLKRVLNRAGSIDVEGALALETEATVRSFLDPETRRRVGEFQRAGQEQN